MEGEKRREYTVERGGREKKKEGRKEGRRGSKVTLIFYPLLLWVTFWVTAVCVSVCVCPCAWNKHNSTRLDPLNQVCLFIASILSSTKNSSAFCA